MLINGVPRAACLDPLMCYCEAIFQHLLALNKVIITYTMTQRDKYEIAANSRGGGRGVKNHPFYP